MSSNTDRIEKSVLVRAPRERVWRAVTTAEEFGKWFGAKLEGQFSPGKVIRGPITHPGYEHLTLEFTIDRMELQRYFSWRWHPYAVDSAVDYSQEPTTLVEFTLEEVTDGTMLRVVESGFDNIPQHRRAEAFRMNEGGWTAQMENIRKYVSQTG
jgi:uncharacterized protein YndB with AHSA1/START domain